jgi:hypothetical protein
MHPWRRRREEIEEMIREKRRMMMMFNQLRTCQVKKEVTCKIHKGLEVSLGGEEMSQ